MAAVQVDSLRREFRWKTGILRAVDHTVVALDGISFDVREGELFGLLGPNGAGKTTTIKILTTLLLPSSGEAKVLGLDVVTQAAAIRRRIGFALGGERGLYYRLSGRDNLRLFAALYRVPSAATARRIGETLQLVGLTRQAEQRVESYSRGMKQRLHLARALLHEPAVLFLDEPTNGLDPVAARDLRAAIRALQESRTTVILTTHDMSEADALADRIAIISSGRLRALAPPSELKGRITDLSVVSVELIDASEVALDRIRALPFVESVRAAPSERGQLALVSTPLGPRAVAPLLEALRGLRVGAVNVREATLEDAYVRFVGEAAT